LHFNNKGWPNLSLLADSHSLPQSPAVRNYFAPPSMLTLYTMNFEFDPKKSDTNKLKHGINFIEAQYLWNDLDLLEIPAKTADEPRFPVIGKIDEKHWMGIITNRNDNIRIISLRRARNEEIELMKAKDLDKKFDERKSIIDHLDLSKARRPNQEQKRVTVDFPLWIIQSLDKRISKS